MAGDLTRKLVSACRSGDIRTVETLLSTGSAGDASARASALHTAYAWGHRDIVRLLIERFDLSSRDAHGITLLMKAAEQGDVEFTRFLISRDADVNSVDETYGATALARAALRGDPDVVRVLLDAGADASLTDRLGNTALLRARKWGRADVVALLESWRPRSACAPTDYAAPDSAGIRGKAVIAFMGPTGSGKTALLNSLLGFTLFPEGVERTTLVPTFVRSGPRLRVRAVDAYGCNVPGILALELDASRPASRLPQGGKAIVNRLFRQDYFNEVKSVWDRFWGPVFAAVKSGACAEIHADVPLPWLPAGAVLADLPGYYGWFPEDTPALHALMTSWVQDAAHCIFVVENTKLFVGEGYEYLRRRASNGGNVSLLVNRMDGFNPRIFGAGEGTGPE
ncbi:MAG: ankyrin repeat domain-containing protein, partial [Pseudomonadota bacterium]